MSIFQFLFLELYLSELHYFIAHEIKPALISIGILAMPGYLLSCVVASFRACYVT